MVDSTLLDLELENRFWSTIREAEDAAAREAANTGGAILQIASIRTEATRGVVSGRVLSAAVDSSPHLDVPRGYAKPRSLGNFHLTWRTLLQRSGDEDIGYLVVQRPLGALVLPDCEVVGSCFVSVEVTRNLHSLGPVTIGTEICRGCSRPIGPKRLNALPSTKICKFCQELKEQQKSK